MAGKGRQGADVVLVPVADDPATAAAIARAAQLARKVAALSAEADKLTAEFAALSAELEAVGYADDSRQGRNCKAAASVARDWRQALSSAATKFDAARDSVQWIADIAAGRGF